MQLFRVLISCSICRRSYLSAQRSLADSLPQVLQRGVLLGRDKVLRRKERGGSPSSASKTLLDPALDTPSSRRDHSESWHTRGEPRPNV